VRSVPNRNYAATMSRRGAALWVSSVSSFTRTTRQTPGAACGRLTDHVGASGEGGGHDGPVDGEGLDRPECDGRHYPVRGRSAG